jgi:hypothetical protein
VEENSARITGSPIGGDESNVSRCRHIDLGELLHPLDPGGTSTSRESRTFPGYLSGFFPIFEEEPLSGDQAIRTSLPGGDVTTRTGRVRCQGGIRRWVARFAFARPTSSTALSTMEPRSPLVDATSKPLSSGKAHASDQCKRDTKAEAASMLQHVQTSREGWQPCHMS